MTTTAIPENVLRYATALTGTVTAAGPAADDRTRPGTFVMHSYTLRTDDDTEQTVLHIAGSAADLAFGRDIPLAAQVGQRVTCAVSKGPYGLVVEDFATGERDADGRKIRCTFIVED